MPGTEIKLYSNSKVPEAHQYKGLQPYYYWIRPIEGQGTLFGKKRYIVIKVKHDKLEHVMKDNWFFFLSYWFT